MNSPENLSAWIHPAGLPFVAGFCVLTVALSLLGMPFNMLGLALLGFCVYFFRNPKRVTPTRTGLIVSPADGRVVAVKAGVIPDADLGLSEAPHTRISIFLNVFDVHVNRIPTDGVVTHRHYRPGKFVNASLDKASVDNERMAVALAMTGDHPFAGQNLGVVQIAGLIARRILCNAQVGKEVKAGARYGIIRFGSRTDIYLPEGIQPLVIVGQRMLGGETVLADCGSTEPARAGEVR